MIALLGLLDLDGLQAISVQQVAGKLCSGAGISVLGLRVPGQDSLHPDAGQEYDAENDEAEEKQVHMRLYYAKYIRSSDGLTMV